MGSVFLLGNQQGRETRMEVGKRSKLTANQMFENEGGRCELLLPLPLPPSLSLNLIYHCKISHFSQSLNNAFGNFGDVSVCVGALCVE